MYSIQYIRISRMPVWKVLSLVGAAITLLREYGKHCIEQLTSVLAWLLFTKFGRKIGSVRCDLNRLDARPAQARRSTFPAVPSPSVLHAPLTFLLSRPRCHRTTDASAGALELLAFPIIVNCWLSKSSII